jgi:hypothetical protein
MLIASLQSSVSVRAPERPKITRKATATNHAHIVPSPAESDLAWGALDNLAETDRDGFHRSNAIQRLQHLRGGSCFVASACDTLLGRLPEA